MKAAGREPDADPALPLGDREAVAVPEGEEVRKGLAVQGEDHPERAAQ